MKEDTKFIVQHLNVYFLIGVLLIIQGALPLKILGIIVALIHRPKIIGDLRGFAPFYVFILGYHLVVGFFVLLVEGTGYFIPYLLVLFFWTISFLITNYLNCFVLDTSPLTVRRTINVLFIICVGVVAFQYIEAAWQLRTLNPYSATQAAGDRMHSVFSNSSESMIIMSFFFLHYIMSREKVLSATALVCSLLAAYMSGTVLFLGCVLLGLLFFSNFKLKYKLYFVFSSALILFLFIATSPGNYKYAMGYINRIVENDIETLPFKMISFWQTLSHATESFWQFLFGAGGGNFSSRIAFIVSGDYVEWFPKAWVHISEDFSKNHYGLWTYDFNNPWDNRNNTANQPFSFYNKILGEYGLIGIVGYFILYFGLIINNWKRLYYAKFLTIVLLGYFVLDYWYEYFSVIVVFELLVLQDIKKSSSKPQIDIK